MADQGSTETNTGGGSAIGGNVGTNGGDFAGRDRNTYNNYGDIANAITDLRIQLSSQARRLEENTDAIASLKYQISRSEDNAKWELRDIGKELDTLKDDYQILQNQVTNSQRTPTGPPPSTALLWLILGGVLILVFGLIGVAIYWSLKSSGLRSSVLTLPLDWLYAYFTILISSTYFWHQPM